MLIDALQECTLALLRKIAAAHGLVAEEDALRVELAQRIAQRLVEPGYLEGYVATLSEGEISELKAVASSGWMAKAFVLERRFRWRSGHDSSTRRKPDTSLSLLHKGLLFRTFATVGSWRGEVYHVPEDLRPAISALPSKGDTTELPTLQAATPPRVVEERDGVFDVFCLLSYLRRENRRIVAGALPRSELVRLEQETEASAIRPEGSLWMERWRFLLHLCLAGGWLARHGSWLKPGKSVPALLAGGREHARARLLARYLRDRSWSDLSAAGRVRQLLGGRTIDEPTARQLLVHHLAELAGREWTEEAAFLAALRTTSPDFLREDFASPAWAVVDVASGVELYGPQSWEAVEGDWIRYLLRGPLRWLGVVRWGLDAEGREVAFQWVHDLKPARATSGFSVLGSEHEPRTQNSELRTQSWEVVAPDGIDLELLYRIEPYLELCSRGRTSLYRLTRTSVLDGLANGGSWQELRELLQGESTEPLPEAALSEAEQWASAYGRYTLEGGILLVAATAADADLLGDIPEISPCLQGRLGITSFRVAPGRATELVQRLRKAGHIPRIDSSAQLQRAWSAAGDVALLRESLFALLVLRALHPELQSANEAETRRRIEAALDPDEVKEVHRRARDAIRRMRDRGGDETGRLGERNMEGS